MNIGKGKGIWISLLPIFIACYLLFSMISISISQIFISISLVCWIIILIRKEEKFSFPSFFWPILIYIGLSLVSSFLSVNMKLSLKDSRELLLFLLIPIVYSGFRKEDTLKKANLALLASATVSSIYSLFDLFIKPTWPREPITGFMGHHMTQGGLLLLFGCMALSMLLFLSEKKKYFWGLGLLLSLVALILAFTRSAWVGMVISTCLILFLYKPKTLIILPLALSLIFLVSPSPVKKRALSIFSLEYTTNRLRIELMRTGMKIIKNYPLFGTGPNTVEAVFQDVKYGLSEEAKKSVHLHNNIVQTAAERGIPTLLAWLTFMVWTFLSLFKLLKNKDPSLKPFTVAALAAVLGLNVAGIFEYNFADSEITALFLYMITIPFCLSRIMDKSSFSP